MRKPKIKYISTNLVRNKSKRAFQEGAKRAMVNNGYVVIAHDGWIVKKFANGDIIQLEKIDIDNQNIAVILD